MRFIENSDHNVIKTKGYNSFSVCCIGFHGHHERVECREARCLAGLKQKVIIFAWYDTNNTVY